MDVIFMDKNIFENEWINHREYIEVIIKSALGIYDKTINAYDCKIKLINKSKNIYGLYYENEFISIITINKSNLVKVVSNMSYDIENIITRIREVFLSKFDGNLKLEIDRRYEKRENLELIEETEPQLIKIENYEIYDCGKLIYKL